MDMTDDIHDIGPIDPPESIDSPEDVQAFAETMAETMNVVVREVQRLDRLTVRALEKNRETDADVEEVRDRLETVHEKIDVVDATMPKQQRGKLEKVRAILEYATSQARGGYGGVKVTTGEAAAAASCSRDTALRLIDEIGATFSWAASKNPGGPKPKQLRLSIGDQTVGDLMVDVREQYGGTAGDATA